MNFEHGTLSFPVMLSYLQTAMMADSVIVYILQNFTTELSKLLEGNAKPILFLYSDGGPDHRVTYISVQIALIALFRILDLDYLCAARTAL